MSEQRENRYPDVKLSVEKEPSVLKLRFNTGKDENGDAVFKTKSYANLRHDLSNADALEVVVQGLGYLNNDVLVKITKVDNTVLSS
ncbi:MAG: DUF1659 domain-containing protein [Paraclostridium sp.]